MEIKGYKGGGGNTRTPVEDPDSLVSNATVRMLLALSEGEVETITPEDLPKRVYLDGTPVQNEDGTVNIPGVSCEFRNGTPTQDPIPGFPAVESETRINVELNQSAPWVRQVTNAEIDAVRIRMNFRLVIQESDGDRVGGRIEYKIEYRKIGDSSYTTSFDGAVDGKQKDNYERDHRIDLPKSTTGWQIRVTRTTPDSTSDTRVLDSGIVAITEIVDARVRYPWTSLLFVSFDAKSFQNIPVISIKMKGRRVKVPSNYDPVTATYTGSWDGTFKQAYTTNPAWHVYDMATHKRYGLGRRIPANFLNKWTMYAIAQRCDELVTNADGSQERRYTSNIYIQKRAQAWTLIRDMVSIFNGLVSYGNQQLQISQDAPAAIRHTVTNDEVVEGKFQYTYGSVENRKGIANVSYDDPANHFKTNVTVVQRKDLVERYGIEPLELSAIGCISEYEAQRRGLWALISNTNDRMVSYRVGLDGIKYLIGDVIAVANKYVQGGQFGGRVVSAVGSVVTVDRAIPSNAVVGDKFLAREMGTDGNLIRDIVAISDDRLQLTLSADVQIQPGEVYLLDCAAIAPEFFRVTKIAHNEQDNNFTVTGLAYSHSKYLEVDTGARIEERPTTLIPTGKLSAPENIVLEGYSIVNQGTRSANLNGSWNAVDNAVSYEIQIRRTSQTNGSWSQGWSNLPTQSTTSVDVNGVLAGTYQIRVRAVGRDGQSSVWAESDTEFVDGKRGAIPDVAGLIGEGIVNGITWRWVTGTSDLIDMKATELQWRIITNGSPVGDFVELTSQTYPTGMFTQSGLAFAQQVQVRARFVSSFGDFGPWSAPVNGMASDVLGDYYEEIDQAIKDSDTYGELTSDIKDVSDSAQAAKDAAHAAQVIADDAVATNQQQQQQLNNQLAEIQKNAQDITNTANAGAANASAIAQEILDRKAGDIANANKAAQDVADAIAKAETDDAAVAKQAADNLLTAKNDVEAQIDTTNITMQDGFDSLSQQMASIAAGTGEQFDSLAIWYFDNGPEGWASDDANTNLLPVDQDGWIYPAGAASTMRSPNPLAIDARSYKYMRLRMKRVGNPSWAGKLYWIGVDETGWNNGRSFSIPAPEFDPGTGITVLSIPDLLWATSGTVRRLRLDLSTNQDANNYYAIDWMAVGRPTPGASQAQIQDLRIAMTASDSAEAAARNTLAVQLRGNYEGTDPTKLVTGIIYNERQTRVTAEQAIASDVNTLRTDYNANKSVVTQRLDTLTSDNQSQAQALTQLQSDLTDANGKIGANATAISQIKTDVTALDGRVSANSGLITNLRSDLDNMRVGGTNLIPNSGTLAGVSGVLAGQTYKGNAIRRIAIAAASAAPYDQFEYDLAAPIDGTEVVVSFYAKANNADSKQIYVYLYSPNATLTAVSSQGKKASWSTGGDGSMIIDLSTDWQRYWVKYTRKAGQTGTQRVIFGRLLKGSVDKEVYISSPKFEYGTMPTEWSEAPADNASASALTALTTRVTAAEGTISTNSQSITQLKGDVSTLHGQMANKAEASALQQLATTVSQHGNTLTSQGQAITDLQNTAQNGKAKYWLTKIFEIKVSGVGYTPKLSDLSGVPPLSVSEMADAAKLDFLAYGDYKIAYAKALVYVAADKTIAISPGSRIVDDTGRMYINGAEVATFDAGTTTYTLSLKKGWNTLEFVVAQITGQFYINFGLKLSDNVDQLFSGAGQLAAASASQVLSSQVEQAAGKVDANSAEIVTLNNSVQDINTALNNKADASALQSLTTRVTTAEGKITAQGNAITQLTSDLSTANGKITANSTAITNLTTRVTAAEGSITSQGQAITKLTSDLGTLTGVVNSKADAAALTSLTTRVTQAEGKLDTQGSAITQLTNNLSNTDASIDAQGKIPGNLLANSSFERGPVNFNGWSSLATIITASQPHSGTKIVRMGSGGSAGIGQAVEITQGRRYRFGVFAKQDAGAVINDPGNTKFRIADDSGLLIGKNYGPFSADWQHVFMDWTATKTTTAQFQLTTWLSAGAMYFDDVYVVDITNDTKIQANADAITTLNTKVTQQGNDITSQGSAITQLNNSLKTVQYSNSNPWVDGSFESYADGQTIGGANGLVTTDFAFSGTKSLMVRRGNGETGNSDKTFGFETAIRESAVYRFECWAMMPETETPPEGWSCLVGLMVRNSAGQASWPASLNINETTLAAGGGRGKWVKFSGKIGAGGTQKTRGSLWISCRGTAGGPGYRVFIDDLVITDVTDAHAAQTTADANSSAINSLTSRVSTAEGKITSQADAITKLSGDVSTINGTLSQKADASAVTALQTRVTTAEGKIASQGTAITNLNNGLEAQRRTGENLVQNYDFMQGETTYSLQRDSFSVVTFGDYGDGKSGVRMVKVNANSPGLFANNKKPIPQNGQRRYRYVVRAKGVSGAMNLLMRRWNFNGAVEGSYADKNNTLTTDWQTLTWETDLTPESGFDGSAFGMYCHPANAEVWIDSFKVYDITEELTIKTNSAAITSLTTRVTAAEGKVTSQGSAITQLDNELDALAGVVDTKASASALQSLTNTVTQQGSTLDATTKATQKLSAMLQSSNAIMNGDLANNADQWQDSGTGSSFTYNASEKAIQSGTDSIRVANITSIPVEPGLKLRVTLEARATAAGFTPSSDSLGFISELSNATSWIATTAGWMQGLTTAFVAKTYDLTIPANYTGRFVYFRMASAGAAPSGVKVLVRNIVVTTSTGVAQKAEASALTQLTATVTNIDGKVTANTQALTAMNTRVGDAESAIDGLNETVASNGLAMATGFNQMRAMIGDNSAAITQQNSVIADLESSTAEQINTINASVGDMSATVQQAASAVADIDGKLSAQWGVKVQTNAGGDTPRVAGVQLGIDATGSSSFLVQADTFGVYTGGTGSKNPFVVKNGTAYMQAAMIEDLSIGFAKISDNIRSTTFVSGSAGWNLPKSGNAEFNNVTVRGHVEASSGSFTGTVIATDGRFNGTVYANRIEGDVGAFAIDVQQNRDRSVAKAQWVWFDLLRIRRQSFDQVVNLLGGLLQGDRMNMSGARDLRAGMSYSPGSDGGLDPGFLSYAILLRGYGATSGGGAMTVGLSLDGRLLNQWDSQANIANYGFTVPAGTGDAVLRYGCYLDRNGRMRLAILSRFSAFVARNSNTIGRAESA